jgi:hypothetical protein
VISHVHSQDIIIMKEEDEVQCCSSQYAKNEVKIVEWTHKDGAKQGSPTLGYGGYLEISSSSMCLQG